MQIRFLPNITFCWEHSRFKITLVRTGCPRSWAEPQDARVPGTRWFHGQGPGGQRGGSGARQPGCRPSRFPGAKAATAGSSSWHVWSDGIQGKKQTPGESRETVIFKAGIVLWCDSGQLSYSWSIWLLNSSPCPLTLQFVYISSNVVVIWKCAAVFSCAFLCEMWENGFSGAFLIAISLFIIGFWRSKNRMGLCAAFIVLFCGWSWADLDRLLPSDFHLC